MLDKLKNEMNKTYTENMGVARPSTNDSLLDFFSQGGALRNRSNDEIIRLFDAAFLENALLAMKMLFYFRDVRGGQGERKTFRTILKYLANKESDIVKKNLHLISEFGRWDDYFELLGTKVENDMLKYLVVKYKEDIDSDKPSLLGKWLKSENTSSKESRTIARRFISELGVSSREYRKQLVALRKKINVVERKMSDRAWSSINYESVPSRASMIYRRAFKKHDGDRYNKYIESVEKGEKKINATVLYPYDIVNKILNRGEGDSTLNALWNALPNYVTEGENSIVVADVSGSMYGHPISVSIGLAIYLAERNIGPFHNHFITFSSSPEVQQIVGRTITDKVNNLHQADWSMNTDIEKVFLKILKVAVDNNASQEEMIHKIYIVSDMEFDNATRRQDMETVFQTIKRKYAEAGYELPHLVFWNVDARNKQYPMTVNDVGVQMVSGCSPSIFKNLMSGKFLSAYELMLEIINDERYNEVKI